jgi:hypothetical protein
MSTDFSFQLNLINSFFNSAPMLAPGSSAAGSVVVPSIYRAQHSTSLCSFFSASALLSNRPLRPTTPRHFLRLRRYTRTDFIFYHCRDIVGPSSCFEHWCRSCRLLCRRDSHDLPSLKDAEPDRMEPRRQLRLHLGEVPLPSAGSRPTSSFLSSRIALTAKLTSCSTIRLTLGSSRRLSLTLGTTSKVS